MSPKRLSLLSACLVVALASHAGAAAAEDVAIAPLLLEKQRLIHEIDCAQPNKDLLFMEYPAGATKVETLLNTPCRVLLNKEGAEKYFAYRVAEGKGLKAGAAYVLTVEYPEDVARTMYICNWGCETALGFATGKSLGDVLKGRYVPTNPESLNYPLSGKMQTWSQLFYLHDRFPEVKRPRGPGNARPLMPEDGFWVVFAQTSPYQDPLGAGTAVSRIRLYEVQDPGALNLKINFPPAGLPRRHIFSREEMADNVVQDTKDPAFSGVNNFVNWYEYKMRIMQFLGIDTFTKDMMEFGHNQGWDSAPGGGNDWVYQSGTPHLWDEIVECAGKLGVNVLPYYEYRGSIGGNKAMALGPQARCRRLDGGQRYTNIDWCEGNNADITDPDTLADIKKVMDVSLLRYKDQAKFVGAWLRQRPSAMPISFSEKNFKMFSAEANGGERITRSHLQADKALLEKYYKWWFGKRQAFLDGLRDHLRSKLGPEAFVLFTGDSSEPGRALPRSITGEGKDNGWQWMQVVVNDDFTAWGKILSDEKTYSWIKPYALAEVVEKDMHVRGLQTFAENYEQWENRHSTPPDDPQTYQGDSGVMLSYTYNRLYTVGSPKAFDAYRTRGGLSLMRHYSLNENEMNVGGEDILGYFIVDVERAGAYCMMAEARAMANGDPTCLGSLPGGSNNRGFPGYVRRFHAAFLSLPALPSDLMQGASSDPEVVVRAIKTEKQGTWYSVVNTGFAGKKDVVITLPSAGKLRDSATGADVQASDGKLTLSLDPAELRAFHAN